MLRAFALRPSQAWLLPSRRTLVYLGSVNPLAHVRTFSLREANALVPRLQEHFEQVRELRSELLAVEGQLASLGHVTAEPPDVDPRAPAAVQRLQRVARDLFGQIVGILGELAQLGIEVKAADGLADFRSRLHGRTVCLCWRFGEQAIGHYHELHGGFAGRRPLPANGDFVGDLLQ
jgi:hypothetical protein